MSPSEKTVLLSPAFSKINRIEQKVKKKSYDVMTDCPVRANIVLFLDIDLISGFDEIVSFSLF